jgi:hypothetical protein
LDAWGGAAGRAGAAGAAGAFGALAAAGLTLAWPGAGAFCTDRIAFGAAGALGAAALGALGRPPLISVRIWAASSSLIELLWLFAAMESFSAASSTSLFSRPRSLDSS